MNNFIYQISGSDNGVNLNGLAYTATITDPLIKTFDCWWIEQGTIFFQVTGLPFITLDNVNSTCEDQATVTVNSKAYNITLP